MMTPYDTIFGIDKCLVEGPLKLYGLYLSAYWNMGIAYVSYTMTSPSDSSNVKKGYCVHKAIGLGLTPIIAVTPLFHFLSS